MHLYRAYTVQVLPVFPGEAEKLPLGVYDLIFPNLYDSPSKLGKQTFIRQFCDTCHAKLMPGEEAFAFIDITSTWTRREGILITNRGFYLSESCNAVRPGSPLLYERISRIVCDPVMKIEYDGAIVKPKLPSNEKIRNFLIFSCMYFKFGQFEE